MSALLQLCETCEDINTVPRGWYMSEKLDGMRCFWDGGLTYGQPKKDCPWAYTKKDARLRVPPVATGLWSRYGGVISAPDWWIEREILGYMSGIHGPITPFLDGELFEVGLRQDLLSIVKGGGDWTHVHYRVYDCPPAALFLSPRTMRVGKDKVGICFGPVAAGYVSRVPGPGAGAGFRDRMQWVPVSLQHKQVVIESTSHLQAELDRILALPNGEGLVVRHPNGLYKCARHRGILKIKGMDEDEALVVGTTDGEGRHLGRIGALVCTWGTGASARIVNLGSGLTDADRSLTDWLGVAVTFRYRGLSRDGQPQEPRYIRRRDYE